MMGIDIVLAVIGILLLIGGILGSFLPVIPGPLLSVIGILMIQAMSTVVFSREWTIVFLVLLVISMLLDYYLPIRGTKKYGGTKRGAIGSVIGLVVGIVFFPPLGIIIFPCLGAFLGEYMIARLRSKEALRSAWGSFVGFLLGTGYKLVVCAWMLFWGVMRIV